MYNAIQGLSATLNNYNSYSNFMSACQQAPNASNLFQITQNNYQQAEAQISNILANKIVTDVSLGIPCTGTALQVGNGDPLVVYTCSTNGFNPEYTCTFTFGVTSPGCSSGQSPNCTMQLISAYCNVPPELIVNSNKFSCGFIGVAESSTVGANQVNVKIESSYGSGLFPFSTLKTPVPDSSNGLVTKMVY